MIVLDTNVVSELVRRHPAVEVVGWVDRQPSDEIHLTAVTVAELLYGVARLPDGQRKQTLAAEITAMIDDDFGRRVLAFDRDAATHYAEIVSERERAGRPISAADAQIAATCRRHGALLATRNVRDFGGSGLTLVDPWQL